ncbi:Bidirectional sugar transporter [Arachis hypogaea]|nr:Bidirectional sugar transporter [Arachis hypogaea]
MALASSLSSSTLASSLHSHLGRQVIKDKSVKYMPFCLSLANFCNVVWTVYACLKWDLFILIPNALGALSGLVQLILYAVFYRSTNWDQESAIEV